MTLALPALHPWMQIDPAAESARIAEVLRDQTRRLLRRGGAVVGLSGGIDSSATAALCALALGPERVLGVLMPERDSDPESEQLALSVAAAIGIETVREDIAPILQASGCYQRRDDAIRTVLPEYGPGWRMKIVLKGARDNAAYNLSWLVAQSPDGQTHEVRLTLAAYRTIVAASNMKQRTRKSIEYYHADRLQYAVAGTPNLLEYDQAFFVKNGDGSADIKPIAHLYKSQVYAIAAHLGVPDAVLARVPTTDTYSLPQTQEEFYFAVPVRQLDICLYGVDHGHSAEEIAQAAGLTLVQTEYVLKDIELKRRAAVYLRMPPLLAVKGEG